MTEAYCWCDLPNFTCAKCAEEPLPPSAIGLKPSPTQPTEGASK